MADAGTSPTDLHRSRLFFGICLALIPTGASFALMSNVVSQLKIEFILSNAQVAWIVGASVWGMAISLVGIGPFLEFFGLKNGARLAFLGHLLGITLFIAGVTKRGDPSAFWILFAGAVLLAMGNGMIEVTGNPLVAALYPDEKTKRLNWFHAFFPIGLIAGGLAGYVLGTYGGHYQRWPYQLALIYIPILVYGVMVLPQTFPKTENSEAGISWGDMVNAVLTSPLMWLMLAMMAITTSLELGPMRWIPSVLTAGGLPGILVFVWISACMMVLRFMSGHAVKKLSPPGMLLMGALLVGTGLFLLSFATGKWTAFAAATVFAFGVAFFFPTMVGTVSERMPRTGSLGIVLTAGVGLGMSGLVMQPFMGSLADKYLAQALPAQTAEFLQRASAKLGEYETRGRSADPATLGYRVEDITLAKKDVDAAIATGSVNNNATATALRAVINTALQNEPIVGEAGGILQPAENTGGQQSFRYVAPLALILVLVFGAMYINDKRKGGYRAVKLQKAAVLLLALALPSMASAQQSSAATVSPAPRRPGPSAPQARTARLRVLFVGDNGHHQPTARAKSLLPYLAQDGIDLYYTNNLNDLNPTELKRYDALMLYTNDLTISDSQIGSMMSFVSNGGGLVVLHCASAAYQNSEEYLKLIGASFKSHGTGVFGAVRLMPDHPILKGVPTWENWEETYVHTKHNPIDRTVLEVRRENGHDEPWTWVKPYGKGRVFYTAWGHDQRTWLQPGFQKMVENATRWTIGDWAMTYVSPSPIAKVVDLKVPIPIYRQDTVWNVLDTLKSVKRAQDALSTRESLQMMTLKPGFSVKPFAMEPLIGNIIDFTWDARGRMWAVETNDYPNDTLPEGTPGHDRILIIEDSNGDGIADRTKVFADGLNLATTLALVNGGVMVGQAPHMLFLKDTNGDEKADERKIMMTGFSRQDTHGTFSNLRYGFDNQVWGSWGYNQFIGTVGSSTYARNQFGSGYFRFPADASSLDYIGRTGNNTWGVALTEDNFVFGSTANRNPTNFVAIPIRYYRSIGVREPTLRDIADRMDVFPVTDIYQVDQFGLYTAGAGHEIYTARAFPKEFWNRTAFVSEPTAHVIGMFDLSDNGSSFRAKNRWSFMASRDQWAAPVQAKVGPDGSVWVSDFYTLIAQHNPTPRNLKRATPGDTVTCCRTGGGAAYDTPNRDKLHGRIYKISWDSAKATPPMRLDNATTAQLVAALKNDNLFWRLMAQRLIVEGKKTDAIPALVKLVDDQTVDEIGLNPGALHALWTMHGLGAVPGNASALAAVKKGLYHPAASVRRAALAILPHNDQLIGDLVSAGVVPDRTSPWPVEYTVSSSLLEDADAHVRLEALLALSEVPASPRVAATAMEMLFVADNARDPAIPDGIAIVGAKQSPDFLGTLLQRRAPNDSLSVIGVARAVQLVANSRAVGADQALVSLIASIPSYNSVIARGLLQGVATGWPDERAPTLTAEQRTALAAAGRAMIQSFPAPTGGRGNASTAGPPQGIAGVLTQLGTKWGSPTLFAQQ